MYEVELAFEREILISGCLCCVIVAEVSAKSFFFYILREAQVSTLLRLIGAQERNLYVYISLFIFRHKHCSEEKHV